jgi:galactose mutarotase-like enzyme
MVALSAGELEAEFVPEAGMVGRSLRHRGEELLGQRGGLEAYVGERKTMGIPLLHPWANRLSPARFSLAGREVAIDPSTTRRDAGGLPMHGLLTGAPGWRVTRHDDAALEAVFDFELAAFPFPHELRYEATLDASALTIALTVTAKDNPVPIAFGFHPYLVLPGVARGDWHVEIPVHERLELDGAMLPTGATTPVEIPPGPLGERTFDDAYTAPSAPFALEGGGRRIELAFIEGYRCTQVFAPPDDPVIAFEPMTAPTNALVSRELTVLAPGEAYRAAFSITVTNIG